MSTEDHPDWWRPMGGQNSQDSILERRSLVWNDNNVEAPDDPPLGTVGTVYIGKFFTRGCRGMLEELQIYCRGPAASTMTLRYSPHPCLGPFGEVIITPGLAWGWVGAVVEEMWNYDSLFVWVHECDAVVSWGYDIEPPYDDHRSFDGGATWTDRAARPFIRAVMTGETPGDVPVSGIVNTIEIPSTAGQRATDLVNVPNGVPTEICRFEGAGTLLETILDFATAVVPAAGVTYTMLLTCDNGVSMNWNNRQLTQSLVATTGRCSCGEFIQLEGHTYMYVRVPIKFRRLIILTATQTSGAAALCRGNIYANTLR